MTVVQGLAHRLADSIRDQRGLVLVLTGAGVSRASGIPTFRGSDPGAIWAHDITEPGTYRYFRRDPVGSWQWYRRRFANVLTAEPNPAHRALVEIERWQRSRGGDFLLITQNLDTLHEQAGSAALVKVHGSADRSRCTRSECRLGSAASIPSVELDFAGFDSDPRRDTIPTCPECGALIRPHVLWFDEEYSSHPDFQWPRVIEAIGRMRLALCIGTSLAVGVTEVVLLAASADHAPLFIMDPNKELRIPAGSVFLQATAESLLPIVSKFLIETAGTQR